MEGRDQVALELFQKLVRIPSTSHLGPKNGTYKACVELLEAEAKLRGFQTRVVEPVEGKPVLICTKLGSKPELQSILLNSHYDVVPVDASKWTMGDPWAANIVDGFVVGRGTQDMKCVCIQHLEGLYRATQQGPLERTVHITFVPDEEIGGTGGMAAFVRQGHLAELNVACALDEGLANPTPNEVTVFYGERAIFWIRVRATGNVGHGSRFIPEQAVQKLLRTVERFMAFRAEQERKLHGHDGCQHAVAHKLGDVVTLNCTMLQAGVTSDHGTTYALNVIPSTAEAGFDIRVPPTVPIDEMERLVRSWCDPDQLEVTFVEKVPEHNVSDISVNSSWWRVFNESFKEQGIHVVPEIFPAGTDSRYLRAAKIPAFGVSPMPGTPILLHDNDERLGVDTFLKGITTIQNLVAKLANFLG